MNCNKILGFWQNPLRQRPAPVLTHTHTPTEHIHKPLSFYRVSQCVKMFPKQMSVTPPLRPRHRERKRGGLAALPRCAPPTATPTRSNSHFPFHQVHSTVILFLKEICCFWNPFAHTNMKKWSISHHMLCCFPPRKQIPDSESSLMTTVWSKAP